MYEYKKDHVKKFISKYYPNSHELIASFFKPYFEKIKPDNCFWLNQLTYSFKLYYHKKRVEMYQVDFETLNREQYNFLLLLSFFDKGLTFRDLKKLSILDNKLINIVDTVNFEIQRNNLSEIVH